MLFGDNICRLSCLDGFTSQNRLIDSKVMRFNEANISGNFIARLEQNIIADRKVFDFNLLFLAITHHASVRGDHTSKRLGGAICFVFLISAHDCINQNNEGNHASIKNFTHNHRSDNRDEQQEYHRIIKFMNKDF